ncbi:MAG: stage II sporulation protein M [Isosphaeraceae bacterium]
MRVVERLSKREQTWRDLERLLDSRPGGRSPGASERALRHSELYRAACADLMLAEAHDLPRETVAYLHDLVARAHNRLYPARAFRPSAWARELFHEVPRRLRGDPTLWLSALCFWGCFVLAGILAMTQPGFSREFLGNDQIDQMEQMYSTSMDKVERDDATMAGFYVFHNAGIGLSCFAWGLTLGLGTIYQLAQNGLILGTVFGHMAGTPYWGNFSTFVTAHGPFELTAIVFAGAAGLRLGWGLIDHQGESRLASLRREAKRALPTVGASVFLFVLAAFLEGFVSASRLPYSVKAGIAIASAALLLAYLFLGGRSFGRRGAPAPEA